MQGALAKNPRKQHGFEVLGPVLLPALSLSITAGCISVRTDPIEVNIRHELVLTVDRELRDYFAEIDRINPALEPPERSEEANAGSGGEEPSGNE